MNMGIACPQQGLQVALPPSKLGAGFTNCLVLNVREFAATAGCLIFIVCAPALPFACALASAGCFQLLLHMQRAGVRYHHAVLWGSGGKHCRWLSMQGSSPSPKGAHQILLEESCIWSNISFSQGIEGSGAQSCQ
jgi:hypothetical protein